MSDRPDKIGKYDITGIAGKGAMGIVYIGHDPYIDRKVAIKVSINNSPGEILLDDSLAADAHRQFFNEAKAAGILDHPNIIKVYEAGDANGQDYIAIEYIEDADTLRSFRKEEKLLPLKELLHYIRQCADGLDYAHSNGITHRDIKPANLLITRSGDIKIADFGIAVRKVHDQTVDVKGFGSPLYMSPEQAGGDKIDYHTDIFSLGVVLYELLTGTHPFQAKTMPALFKNIVSENPVPLENYRTGLPPGLEKIINKALQKKPEDRYASSAEFSVDLMEVEFELETFGNSLTSEKKLEMLYQLKYFTGFSESEIEEVFDESEWEVYSDGDEILTEGEQDRSFYIIISGHASVIRMGKEIATLDDGDCFGEMAWLMGGKRSATVKAITKTIVLSLNEPLVDWASLSCQMRTNKVIQKVLMDRLNETSQRYARAL